MSFIPWIEDDNVNATQDYNTYLNDSQRKEGFKGGTPSSAIRVNTALRQANLVAAALMNALNVDDTLNYRNDMQTVANAINTTLTDKIQTTKVNNAKNSDKVNNLEIKQDENGVLKIGDIIIPQKKVIYENEQGSSVYPNKTLSISYQNTSSLIGKKLVLRFDESMGYTGDIGIQEVAFVLSKNSTNIAYFCTPELREESYDDGGGVYLIEYWLNVNLNSNSIDITAQGRSWWLSSINKDYYVSPETSAVGNIYNIYQLSLVID